MKTAFIGGGNMATAVISGLLRQQPDTDVLVVDPSAARREELQRGYRLRTAEQTGAALKEVDTVVLAVKPQQMREACVSLRPWIDRQLIVSVAAGVRAVDLARWLGTERIVRTMPNTPALIGRGITGMIALPAVDADARALADTLLRTCGDVVWFDSDAQLDSVTALSGSGPAYVFYFIEALMAAGDEMGFTAVQSRKLAVDTVLGAALLASASSEPIDLLRERVTSKGGTTAAALASFERDAVAQSIVRAVRAAERRAGELGDEFGRG